MMQTSESKVGAVQSHTSPSLGSLYYDLYHCGSNVMLTLSNYSTFRFKAAYGESKICPIYTVTVP